MEFLARLHPQIVHFPIALFFLYTFFETAGLLIKRDVFTKAAYLMLILGMIGAVAAVLTGNQAEETWKNWNLASHNLLELHESFATLSLWYFLALLILRTFFVINVELKNKFSNHSFKMKFGFVLLAFIGCYFVYQTGLNGGKMVYNHGVGVSVNKELKQNQMIDED